MRIQLKRHWAWPSIFYGATAVLFTWPLVTQLTRAIPLGSEPTPTVPLFNLWTLGWNVNRLGQGYAGYWDAPIFYPTVGALAFSEPQPLTGLLAAPFWTISPATAYNTVLLLFLLLNGLAAFTLLRHRGLRDGPALLGGLLLQAAPFLAYERGVLQLQPVFGVLWAIDAVWLWIESQPKWIGWQFGLAVAVTFLTSEYYALFLGLALLPAIPFLIPRMRQVAFWKTAVPVIALMLLLVLPVAFGQQQRIATMGFSRSEKTVLRGSATWAEYRQPPVNLWIDRWLDLPVPKGQQLFPGVMVLGLAIGGVFVGLRQPRFRRWTVYLLAATAVSLLLSFGLNIKVGSWQPYTLLRDFVPGFANLRSPFRLAYFVQIFLILLAALSLDWVWLRQKLLALLLVGLTLLELLPQPARLTAVPSPIATDNISPPAVFLPFPNSRSAIAYADTAAWMAATISDPVPLLNGYSGYFPQVQTELKTLLADFPTPLGLSALRALGVQTVLIREDWLDEGQWERLDTAVAENQLQFIGRQKDLLLYRLPASQLQAIQTYDGRWDVLVTTDATEMTVWATPNILDETQMYVLAPQIAPLSWRVQLINADGQRVETYNSTPAGSALLYHDSERAVHVHLPRPSLKGTYTLVLYDLLTDQKVGETELVIR